MKYAIMIGSNMFIGTNGVFNVEINGKNKEFFKIREIFNERSNGSYLAIDCDIKDSDNEREIKLFKSKPVVKEDSVTIQKSEKTLTAYRPDDSIIIRIEQLDSTDSSLPKTGPIPQQLGANPVDAILRITGDFYAGNFKVHADNSIMKVGGISLGGNLSVGTGGIRLTQKGFSM